MKEPKELGLVWLPIIVLPDGTVEEPEADVWFGLPPEDEDEDREGRRECMA